MDETDRQPLSEQNAALNRWAAKLIGSKPRKTRKLSKYQAYMAAKKEAIRKRAFGK